MTIKDAALFPILPGGLFAVDAFFFLSGLLTFALLTSKLYPRGGKGNYLLIYLHRWLRLAIPVALVMLFAVGIYPYIGEGAFYNEMNELLV